jgi:murein DD-endopeptidase MepM/ murein hydrolase activator NlpD
MLRRSVVMFIVLTVLPVRIASAQDAAWLTYTDRVWGYAFQYSPDARLSVEGNTVFVALNQSPPYQGYAVMAFDNPARLQLDRFLIEQRGFASNAIHGTIVGGQTVISVDGDPDAYWLPGEAVEIKFQLIAAAEGSAAPSALARAAFERAIQSFRSIPRTAPLPPTPIVATASPILRPAVAGQFRSPFDLPSTTQFETQWNIITSDTRYGVRNLALPGTPRKCFNVTWPRMLHSGMDLYRADGIDPTGLTVYAVADGQVAFYDLGYASYPGRVVIVGHLLNNGRTLYSMYAHLGSVWVSQGQPVSIGQPIGTILYQPGDSHLHFELRWFLDGHGIYPWDTSCNGVASFYYGRGYTYLIHPDNFPAPDAGYVNPDAFIQAHGGPALTPIGLPDPYTPTMSLSPSKLDLAPARINTDTLTYTISLPLIAYAVPRLQPACEEGQELLTNGGFEDGPGSAPWVQVRNGSSDLISASTHYSGAYGLYLGGRNTADEEALQSFVVPYYTDGLTVTFKRLLTTQETEPTVYDHFEVVIENNVGNELSSKIGLSNLSPYKGIWISEQAAFTGFAPWGNQRLRLSIKGMTDSNLLTNLYVDEVSVRTQCVP